MFQILYDGTVMDERNYSALGGDSEAINARLAESFADGVDLAAAVRLGISALAGPDRTIPTRELEVATLSRGNGRRCFRRLSDDDVDALIGT
jgi:proteasome alpha subunit